MPQRHLRSTSKVSLRNSFHIRQKLVQTQVARISTTLNLPNRALICAHLTLGSWLQRLTTQVRVHFSQSTGLSNNIDYGKNRALLSWYHIDRLFTQRNSSLVPGYIKNDVAQLSNPYVREIPYSEVFPGRELNYGESSIIQTLNLSFYPQERGPYNLDALNLDPSGNLLYPENDGVVL